ncbi:uncharacterized protein P174DRAFT_435592 [Aspergillus novofumigatus IBT 16806]|uniref:Ecp2 effector protein-like domain-containing protein n=1 Tax=Aspergillus novofumigatus (strain IBT 16806) TaxID=1392255 RepID=A0A2I1BUA6_ASPN1|nr:uncharacterized protein P174DRAFT_435592 [Aspergillus novofumigatus IBT 16806]PKX88871.1 hypothetical protein P174DRAFT_435592 [Aspergillus novofumigatus IBT 16806]
MRQESDFYQPEEDLFIGDFSMSAPRLHPRACLQRRLFAFKAWDQPSRLYTNVPNYPCIPPQAPTHCGDLMFVNQTSNASLSLSDCMQTMKSIQKTDGDWEVKNTISNEHQLVQFSSCAFWVQGQGKNSNINFNISAQDIINIVLISFSWSGKVGAKGVMSCDRTVKGQQVECGLY